MKEFGEYLRDERISRGITLETIQKRTRIRMQYLLAMEQGEFSRLPEPTYIRAFLRHYATCVGLDPEEVLARYDAIAGAAAEVVPDGTRSERWIERRARRHKARRRQRLILGLMLLLIIAAAVSIQRWGYPWTWFEPPAPMADGVNGDEGNAQGNREMEPTPQQETAQSVLSQPEVVSALAAVRKPDASGLASSPVAETMSDAVLSEEGIPSIQDASAHDTMYVDTQEVEMASSSAWDAFRRSVVGQGRGPFIVPDGEEGFQIALHTTDRSWIELWIDGERRVYRNAEAGERLVFPVEHSATLRLGRAEYVELTIQSVPMGTVGNGVVDKEFLAVPSGP